jgi:hypothetical protein
MTNPRCLFCLELINTVLSRRTHCTCSLRSYMFNLNNQWPTDTPYGLFRHVSTHTPAEYEMKLIPGLLQLYKFTRGKTRYQLICDVSTV